LPQWDRKSGPTGQESRNVGLTRLFAGVLLDMPYRVSIVVLVLVCGLIAAVRPLLIRAAEIPGERRQAILMQNPDPLIKALRGTKEGLDREADASAVLNDHRSETFDDPATPVGGNPKGDVTIVEFFDYRCPYCKRVQPELQALLDQDRKLRLIYKEMPVLGSASVVAARAALAAQRQGKYEAFHAAMMGTKGQITEDTVDRIAESVGLDVDWLKQDMAAPEIMRTLRANLALANALNIHGTPGFIIGNRIVMGALDLDTLKNMIAAARKS
jgi:protein-disulfide isomerase